MTYMTRMLRKILLQCKMNGKIASQATYDFVQILHIKTYLESELISLSSEFFIIK